jgi:gamma-glutamyl-gamma-aminobutyrate hydrolase PuuD
LLQEQESFGEGGVAEYDAGHRSGTYPETQSLTMNDFLTAEEAATQAIAENEKYLGKQGVPEESPLLQPIESQPRLLHLDELNDDMPDFLHTAAKAGPTPESPLDMLGRKKPVQDNQPTQLPAIVHDAKEVAVRRPRRTVTLIKDHDLVYPDLYMSIFVLPDPDQSNDLAAYARMFARSGCYGVKKIEDADLVIFSGGSDVDPRLYNEERHDMTYFDSERDDRDMEAYLICRENGIPMLGVCRGAQFLHVMNGGKLFQHVDNHYGSHPMKVLADTLLIEQVSSCHHQMVIQNIKGGMKVIGVSHKSKERWRDNNNKETGEKPDIEAFFYRDTGCFGVQGHPEYQNNNRFQTWTLEMINELFLMNPDYEWQSRDLGGRYRMKKELLVERKVIGEEIAKNNVEEYIEQAYSGSMEAK